MMFVCPRMRDMSHNEPIPQHKAVPSSPPRSNFVKLTNGAARRDSAGIPKFDRASYITREQGRSEGVPCSLLSSSNIEKGESRGRDRDRDGGARRLWLIFAIIQSVCWCSRIPWMEGGETYFNFRLSPFLPLPIRSCWSFIRACKWSACALFAHSQFLTRNRPPV